MTDYYIIDSEDKLKQAMDYLQQHEGIVSFDTETTSVNTRKCELLGISFCITPGEAFYIVIKDYPNQSNPIDLNLIKKTIQEFLCNPKRQLVAHNASFDILVLRNTLGIDVLPYLYADTLLCKHLVDERRPHDLKSSAFKYLSIPANEQEDLKQSVIKAGGKWNKNNKDMYLGDTNILGQYSCADADMCYQLFFKLWDEMEKQNLVKFYNEESHPLLKVTINHLLTKGVYCDIPYFTRLKDDLSKQMIELEAKAHKSLKDNYGKHYNSMEMEILEKEFPLKKTGGFIKELLKESGIEKITKKTLPKIYEEYPQNAVIQFLAGTITEEQLKLEATDIIYTTRKKLYKIKNESPYIINLSSTKVLKTLLFDKLGESPIKKTKKDNAQVDEEVMTQFVEEYEWIDFLMQYRKLAKLVSTYIDAVLELNENGVIYPNWQIWGTASGRFACSHPNYQNLPSDDDRIKKGIKAPEGYVLIGSDYSQLEPRIFSSLSNEPNLINSFIKNEDFYGTIACEVFDLNCPPDEVKDKFPKERKYVKQIGLGIPYGLKRWKLSYILEKSPEEAQLIIDRYWEIYPNLQKWVNKCYADAYRTQTTTTDLGRIRHLNGLLEYRKNPDMQKQLGNLLNISVNHRVQGLASSIINRAMATLSSKIEEQNLDGWIMMQIHDELVCCVKKDQAEQVSKLMKESMEGAYQLKVPLIANPIIGSTLAECK